MPTTRTRSQTSAIIKMLKLKALLLFYLFTNILSYRLLFSALFHITRLDGASLPSLWLTWTTIVARCWCYLSKRTNKRVYQELVYRNKLLKKMLTGSAAPFPPRFSHDFFPRLIHIDFLSHYLGAWNRLLKSGTSPRRNESVLCARPEQHKLPQQHPPTCVPHVDEPSVPRLASSVTSEPTAMVIFNYEWRTTTTLPPSPIIR